MSLMADTPDYANLFASLISDIKTYSGNDPLIPWLQGIKKMKESLPPQILKEKLPRFLQKCARNFEADKKYRNDLRYLRVWIQLMDFVDDPKGLLRIMEMNKIGTKRALFYQAYALYYEKIKKFKESEKMYHLGVQNLAQPAGELQKSYDQFLRRMDLYEKRKARREERRAATVGGMDHVHQNELNLVKNGNKIIEGKDCPSLDIKETKRQISESRGCRESPEEVRERSTECLTKSKGKFVSRSDLSFIQTGKESSCPDVGTVKHTTSNIYSEQRDIKKGLDKQTSFCSDDTTVVKFVGSAIVGKFEVAEDACHHGLVDPTINMKEAMTAINDMFREPLEVNPKDSRSQRSRPSKSQSPSNGFEVFVDESLDSGKENISKNLSELNAINKASAMDKRSQKSRPRENEPVSNGFEVFVDESLDSGKGKFSKNNSSKNLSESETFDHPMKAETENSLQEPFRIFVDREDEIDDNKSLGCQEVEDLPDVKAVKDETIIRHFLGSTVFGEPRVENACHHGLVDPTINLKEAMDDINSMFGKPLDFFRTNKLQSNSKLVDKNQETGGFSIYTDDALEERQHQVEISSSSKMGRECDLFEPTVFTKEARDEINEMFGKPLDF